MIRTYTQANSQFGRKVRQKGAISLFAAAVTLLLFMFMALTLDAGRLWVEKRKLQKAADMAALASARFTGCGGSLDMLIREASKVAGLNGLTGLGAPQATVSLQARRGYLSTNAQGEYIFNDVLGNQDNTNASQITVSREVPKSILLGGLWGGTTPLQATATARGGPPVTTYSMGASVITIDNDFTRTLNAFFEGIFRNGTNLNATTIQKLSASTVSLEDLMVAGNFNSVEELMASQMTIGDLLRMYGDSASINGADNDVLGAISQLVSAAKPSKTTDTLNVKLSDVLSLNTGNKEALLDAEINLLNLIKTSVTVAGKGARYDLEFKTELPGIGYKIQIGDVPQIAIGPGGKSMATGQWCTTSKSTQTVMTFNVGNDAFNGLINFALLGLIRFETDLQLKLSFGNARANLSYLEPKSEQANVHFLVDTNPMTLAITNKAETEDGFIGFKSGTQKYGIAFGTKGQNRTELSAETPVNIPVPTPVKPTFRAGSSEIKGALAGILNSIPAPRIEGGKFFDPFGLLSVVNALIEGVLNTFRTTLMATLGNLLGSTIDPLLRIMGVNIGSADITIYDIKGVMPQLVQTVEG